VNPYKIEGPAIISFSGGRTSGFMLRQILDAHDGVLPDDVIVSFQNTGKEMPETLNFIQKCSDQWNVPINWLEFRRTEEGKMSYTVVNHNSASRNGEPFEILLSAKRYLPNPAVRLCTYEMKIRTVERYCKKELGWKNWDMVIGLRADEQRRVSNMRRQNDKSSVCWETTMPLADANISKWDIKKFWDSADFDLQLPNINGSTPMGNCDLCFLKGTATLLGIIRERPELAQWWIDRETEAVERHKLREGYKDNADILQFRKDRPSYKRMLELTQEQGDFFNIADDSTVPCMCTD